MKSVQAEGQQCSHCRRIRYRLAQGHPWSSWMQEKKLPEGMKFHWYDINICNDAGCVARQAAFLASCKVS